MIISLILIAMIALGGMALTYLISEDEPLLWRLSAGAILGTAVFGTAGFLLACVAGLSAITVGIALAITLLPLALLSRPGIKETFAHDRAKASGRLSGASVKKLQPFLHYLFFFVLFILFFDRAMIVTEQGIFTGGSNNLGDLPFHLGAIFSFTDGANFPPENPNFAGTRFSYPFIADLATAMFMKLGADVKDAMFVQNVAWALSLLVVFEGFILKLVNNRVAAKVAPYLLFFSGGLGFIWFLGDYWQQQRGFFELLWNLGKDYTIGDEFRWGNSLITLFLTQRGILLGMPLTLVLVGVLWKIFSGVQVKDGIFGRHTYLAVPFMAGLFAGLLPLVHVHSLLVLFVIGCFMLLMRPMSWREWIAFAAGTSLIAVPELIWSTTGSATKVSNFVDWHFGFDARDNNVVWFWIKNTGVAIPLVFTGIYLAYRAMRMPPPEPDQKKKHKKTPDTRDEILAGLPAPYCLILFYLPFVLLFIVGNVVKLAPWEWDNIKILIYWFVGSHPFITLSIAWLWSKKGWIAGTAVVFVLSMILAGALDVWRTVSAQINYGIFDADGVAIANRIRAVTPPDALFLNAPTYKSAVLLTGRRSVMRHPGHLHSHGIYAKPRENDVLEIYRGGPRADELISEYGIDYIIISPEEHTETRLNEEFFKKFPIVAESGRYRVLRVEK
jgi:hypothetical protein